jgi:hypothetical protein
MNGPLPGPYSQCILSSSNYQSGAVAVNYTFNIIPSYIIKNNSTLTIDFPNLSKLNYSSLSLSNPPETCQSDLGNCLL